MKKKIVTQTDLLLEIGCEELPAGYIPPAAEQLQGPALGGGGKSEGAHIGQSPPLRHLGNKSIFQILF
ncbi:MAG: hypothetical protein KBB79_04630, partial [Candidatus Omnitrophica bacterium]|nr:hypothetical protein [Candidatus Omnitrophota bacterium]